MIGLTYRVLLSALNRLISPCKGAGRPTAEQLTLNSTPALISISLRLLMITGLMSL